MFASLAPGGFINATNHYIRLNFQQLSFDWLANTLNPYYESVDFGASVLDDRFIQQLRTLDRWAFGGSNRGDILEPHYIDNLEQKIRSHYDLNDEEDAAVFDFVTGDGAFDCFENLGRQEEMVFQLIYREVTIGLRFLKSSGSLVVKFFTFFSPETISLLYYLSHCFDRVVGCKPVASKHGNSEIYVVCLEFNRDRYLELAARLNLEQIPWDRFMFGLSILGEDGFLDRLVDFTEWQAQQQMDVIDYNLGLYNRGLDDIDRRSITRDKFWVGETWLQCCRLAPINLNEQLLVVDGFVSGGRKYSQHLVPLLETWQTQGHDDERFLAELRHVACRLELISQTNQPLEPTSLSLSIDLVSDHIRPVLGQPYDRVNNSKFCCNSLLKTFSILSNYLQQQTATETEKKELDDDDDDVDDTARLRQHLQAVFGDQAISSDQEIQPTRASCFDDLLKQFLPNVTGLHCFDLFDLTTCFTSNDTTVSHSLYSQLADLITAERLSAGDHLVVRVKGLLSRLSLGVLYLAMRMFELYSVNCWHLPGDQYASLVVVCKNFRVGQSPSIEQAFQSNTIPSEDPSTVLEVLPVQLLINDATFFNRVHAANCLVIAFRVAQMLKATDEATAAGDENAVSITEDV